MFRLGDDTFRTYVWLSHGRKAHHGGRPNYGGSGAPSQPNHPSQLSTNTPHPQPIIIAANAILIGAQHPTNDFMCHMHHQAALNVVAPGSCKLSSLVEVHLKVLNAHFWRLNAKRDVPRRTKTRRDKPTQTDTDRHKPNDFQVNSSSLKA